MKYFSKRTQSHIQSPAFQWCAENKQKMQSMPSEEVFRIRLELDQDKLMEVYGHVDNEGCLTQAYFQTNFAGIDLGFIDALFHNIQGKSRRNLIVLSSREIENFMRDINHEPAFPSDNAPSDEIWKVIDVLINEINKALSPSLELSSLMENYVEKPLVEKIKSVEHLIDKAIRPSLEKDGGDIKLVNINGNQILVNFQGNCSNCPSSTGATLEFVSDVFKKYLGDSLTLEVVS